MQHWLSRVIRARWLGLGLLTLLITVTTFIWLPRLMQFSSTQILEGDSTQILEGDRSSEVKTVTTVHSPSLRELAQRRGIWMGASALVDPLQTEPLYSETLAQKFNLLTPENEMKFSRLHPERDRYDFTKSATLVNFAKSHQMQVYGHTLVWYRHLPDWLEEGDWSREELMEILQQHIYTVVGRFRGQVQAWDVVNEAVENNGSLRDSIWLKGIGSDYIELAFRWAHEADPDARLFYNDYRGEGLGKKSDAIYALVADLKQRNVPIHGVGLQMHLGIQDAPDPKEVAQNIERLNALGLEVRITEMDVQIYGGEGTNEERLRQQASVYRSMMRVCLAASNCTGITTWGLSDQYSWVPYHFERSDAPLLFDNNYQPKPAYDALVEVLSHDEL